ncbi:MAG: hypothetical protein QOK17_377 [Sphingomonadales bacterium]|nr:hypothetical protein [Sphingomonadales bacterium]
MKKIPEATRGPRPVNGEIRVAPPGSTQRIQRFYEDNPSVGVLPRPFEVLDDAIEQGLATEILVEGKTIAVALVFPLATSPPLLEFGGARVESRWEGRGLQKKLFLARFCAVAQALGGVDGYRIVSGASPIKSPKSITSIQRMGFLPFEIPPSALLNACCTCPDRAEIVTGRACCCNFYHLGRDALLDGIEEFAALPSFTVPSSDDGTEVRIDNRVLTETAKVQLRDLFQHRELLGSGPQRIK